MTFPRDFFDLHDCEHEELFHSDKPVWTVLDRLPAYIASLFKKPWPLANHAGMVEWPVVIIDGVVRDDVVVHTSDKGDVEAFEGDHVVPDAAIIMPGAYLFDDRIIIGPRTVVEPGALIKGPTVLGADVEVRQGAYMRGNCLIGNRCVVGHTTEIKGSIMLDGAKAGHFAYIGDSILGRDINLGAGTKLANLKVISGTINIMIDNKSCDTGRRKLGAILGDRTETGCNSVTSPGTLMKRDCIVYPAVCVPGGYYPERTRIRPSRNSIEVRGLGRVMR